MATAPLDSVLARFGLSQGSILDLIDEHNTAVSVQVVGSLVEGFETSTSDIDILLTYPRSYGLPGLSDPSLTRPRALREEDASFPRTSSVIANRRAPSGIKLQLEITTEEMIEALQDRVLARLDNIADRLAGVAASQHRKGALLTLDEQKLLNRFYTGVEIQPSDLRARLGARLPHKALADLVAIMRMSQVDFQISSLVGIVDRFPEGQVETKVYITQKLLVALTGALLAAVGEASGAEKFIFLFLQRHAPAIGAPLVARVLESYRNATATAETRPLDILSLVETSLARASELSPILGREFESWKQENRFALAKAS